MQFPTVDQVVAWVQRRYLGFVEAAYRPPPPDLDVARDGTPPKVFYLLQYALNTGKTSPDGEFRGRTPPDGWVRLERGNITPLESKLTCEFRGRTPLNGWVLERGNITPLESTLTIEEIHSRHYPNPESWNADSLKMYQSYGLAEFSYDSKTGILEDRFIVGSLFGRGYVVYLRLNEQEQIEVSKHDLVWLS